jgi:hypothetical protein
MGIRGLEILVNRFHDISDKETLCVLGMFFFFEAKVDTLVLPHEATNILTIIPPE